MYNNFTLNSGNPVSFSVVLKNSGLDMSGVPVIHHQPDQGEEQYDR